MFTFKTHLDSNCKSYKGIWSHKRYYLYKMSRNHIHRTVTLHAIKVHCKVLFISKQRLGNFVELFENFKFLCLSVEFRNFSPLYFSFPDISFYFNVYVGGIAHGLIVKKHQRVLTSWSGIWVSMTRREMIDMQTSCFIIAVILLSSNSVDICWSRGNKSEMSHSE